MLRLLGVLAIAALAAALLFGACLAACGVAVVSVASDETPRIVAPVPLFLPLAALEVLPDDVLGEKILLELKDREGAALAAVQAVLASLEGAEDATLVHVTEGDTEVLIAVEAEDLVARIREEGADTRVFLRAPIRALAEAVAACDPAPDATSDSGPERSAAVRCDRRALARGLIRFARGTEIEVRDGETRVDISIW